MVRATRSAVIIHAAGKKLINHFLFVITLAGLSIHSICGLSGLANACTMSMQYTAGYKVGKLVQVLLHKFPSMVGRSIGDGLGALVFVFKEPVQALLPNIMESYKNALKVRVWPTRIAQLFSFQHP